MQIRGMLKTFDRVGKTLTINTFFMNKVKMFFIAAAMLLTTAGVFAGKAKFVTTNQLYASNNGNIASATSYALSTNALTFDHFSTSGISQATIKGSAGATGYGLYYVNISGTLSPLYTTSF